jgi:hypothetical protein
MTQTIKDVLTVVAICICWVNTAVNLGEAVGHLWAATSLIISSILLNARRN